MSRFHFKHFSLYHDRSTMKVGTDAVLLAAWVDVKPTDCLFIHRRENIIPVEGKEPNRVNLELRYGKPASLEVSELVIRLKDVEFSEDYQNRIKDFYLG